MKTILIKTDRNVPDPLLMKQAGEIIKSGGLVAFPTETVYGLGGDALNSRSSEKIYAAKGRPSDNPLIVHIADMEHLGKIAENVPQEAYVLAGKFWPGPLTMIFRKTKEVPYETTGGLDTVAVRMPSHEVARAFIRASGGYIAAPSANTSGRPSPTLAEHVLEDLDGKIDMIIDSGEVNIGIESTIVDFTDEVPTILRPGFVSEKMLGDILGNVRTDPGIMSENSMVRPKAPGMRYRHYAPGAPLIVVEGEKRSVASKIRQLASDAAEKGMNAGIICVSENAPVYDSGIVKCIGRGDDEDEIARNLYAVLRQFDLENVDVIYSEAFDTPRLGDAIMNRLLKAAGHEVIKV